MFALHRLTRRRLPITRSTVLLALAACSADPGSGSPQRGANTGGASAVNAAAAGSGGAGNASNGSAVAPAGSGGRAGGPAATDGASPSSQSESCASRGSTRRCCGTGVQTCMGSAEFPVWGPCVDGAGSPVVCKGCAVDEFAPGCDAGSPPPPTSHDAGSPPPPPPTLDAGEPPGECGPGMECKPGSLRYCDVFGLEWSESECDATGHWGECVAATIPAAADGAGCAQDDYAPELCCPVAVICCQDNPDGPFVDFGSGACAAVSCP